MMEKDNVKASHGEGERVGASERTTVAVEAKSREGSSADTDHRKHHTKTHKSSGGHKRSKKKSASSGHKQHSRSSSRRDSHSHTRHTPVHQAEVGASAAAERHGTVVDNNSGSAHSSSNSAAKAPRDKTKAEKSAKSNRSSSSAKGSTKDRSKRESCSRRKKRSHKGTDVEEAKRSSSSTLSSSSKKDPRGREGLSRDGPETKRSNKPSRSTSRSRHSSRSSSLHISRRSSRNSNSSRSSEERGHTRTAHVATGLTTITVGKQPVEPPPLPPTRVSAKGLLLGTKQELLPLPPLPKAAAAAAAALQEQCSKKKGQQAKAAKRTATLSSVTASLGATDTNPGGERSEPVRTTADATCTLQETAVGLSEKSVSLKPACIPQQVRSSGKVETSGDAEKGAAAARDVKTAVQPGAVHVEAAGIGAGASALPKPKIPTHTLQKKKEPAIAPPVAGVTPVQFAGSTSVPSKHTAAGAERGTIDSASAGDEERACQTAIEEATVETASHTKDNLTEKTAAGGTEGGGTHGGEGETKKRATTNETFAASRKTPARRRAKVVPTGDTPRAATVIAPQHESGKADAAANCATTVLQKTAEQSPLENRKAAETAPGSVTEPTGTRGSPAGAKILETAPSLQGVTGECRALQEGPHEEGGQGKLNLTTNRKDVAATTFEEHVQKHAAAAGTNEERVIATIRVRALTSSLTQPAGIAAAGGATGRRPERGVHKPKGRRKEEKVAHERTVQGSSRGDEAVDEGEAAEHGRPRLSPREAEKNEPAVDDVEKVKEDILQQQVVARRQVASDTTKTETVDHRKTRKQTTEDETAAAGNGGGSRLSGEGAGKCKSADERGGAATYGPDVTADSAGISHPVLDTEKCENETAEAAVPEKAESSGAEGGSSEKCTDTEKSDEEDSAATAECHTLKRETRPEKTEREPVTGSADDGKTTEKKVPESEVSEERNEEEKTDEEGKASERTMEGDLQRTKMGQRGVLGAAEEHGDGGKMRSEEDKLQKIPELPAAKPQRPEGTQAAGRAQAAPPEESMTGVDEGKDKSGLKCATGQSRMVEERDSGEDTEEEHERTPAEAVAGDGDAEDAASAISSLAVSPSRYYSPSVADGSKSSSPGSQAEATPKEAGSAADEREGEAETDGLQHREKPNSVGADETTVGDTTAQEEKPHTATPFSGDEKSAEVGPQVLTSGSGLVSEAAADDGAIDALSSSGLFRATDREIGEDTDAEEQGVGEVKDVCAWKESPIDKASLAAVPVIVAGVDTPAEDVKTVVADAEPVVFAIALSSQATGTVDSVDGRTNMVAKEKLRQTADPTTIEPNIADAEVTLPDDERKRQRAGAVPVATRSRVWEDGLRLWRMLLRCEEVAYDVVYLRVLGSFACPRAEFVSVSSGCLGQPERAGDAAEMLQQQEQLMMQFHAVRSRLQAGMGRGVLGVGLMRRRNTRLQQTLLSVGRRMEEELLQVNQLLQLQGLQHLLQQQRQERRRRSTDSSGTRRLSSTETATGNSQEKGGRNSGSFHRIGGSKVVEDDERQGMWTGKGLLQLMSATPLCWYVHDVVGMVCRRRSGGPFPERWAEYREWHGELVLEDVYNEWKAVTLQRKKVTTAQLQNCASAGAAASAGRSKEPNGTGDKGTDVVSEDIQEKARRAAANSADGAEREKQQQEVVQKTSDQKTKGGGLTAGPSAGEATELSATSPTAAPAPDQNTQTDKQQRIKSEKEALEVQHEQQRQSAGIVQKTTELPAGKNEPAKEEKKQDTRDGQGGMDAKTGVDPSARSSSVGSTAQQCAGGREEQGTVSSKKRKRTEAPSPTNRFSVIRGGAFCSNEEMVRHLVLLPCKSFLAERFFITFPERKALSFGTGSLKQRITALRQRRSWRGASLRVKQLQASQRQPQLDKDEHPQEQVRLEEQEQQQEKKGKREDIAETKAAAAETLAPISKQPANSEKNEAAPRGSTSDEPNHPCNTEKTQDQQRQQQVVAKQEQTKTKSGEEQTLEEDEEAPAKRPKKGTGEEATDEAGVATEVAALLEGPEKKPGGGDAAGETNETKAEKGLERVKESSAQQEAEIDKASATGTSDSSADPDVDPEVVAVINLCMTERYYPLPELRAQGIECYWLKVDGSGELPTDKVLCVFFRLLAFITHKYAKLKKQQQEAAGGLDSAESVGSCEKATLPAMTSSENQVGETSVGLTNSAEAATPGGSSEGKVGTEAAAGRLGASTIKRERAAPQQQKLKEDDVATDISVPIVDETKLDPPCTGAHPAPTEKFTVLVHCTNGVNRTGLFTALLLMNLMGCDCNFALKTFSDARGFPVTKEMFKRWLRTEEAKGLSKMYRQALQPPVLQGGVLAYKQRQQQLLEQQLRQKHEPQQQQREKEKERQSGVHEKQKGNEEQHVQDAVKQSAQEEIERECQQQKSNITEDAQYEGKKLEEKGSAAGTKKSSDAAAASKCTGKGSKKKQLRKKQTSSEVSKGEQQPRGEKEQKQTLQKKKQRQAQSDQKVLKEKQEQPRQESSQQAPEAARQCQQQQTVEQLDEHKDVTPTVKETETEGQLNEENLTIATPFALLTAFETERNFERNLEARLSTRLQSILIAREDERQRLLAAVRRSQHKCVVEKCQPTNHDAAATAAVREANSGGVGRVARAGGAAEGTCRETAETQQEKQVPQEEQTRASKRGTGDADGAGVSTAQGETGKKDEALRVAADETKTRKIFEEKDHHKGIGSTDSDSVTAGKKTAAKGAEERPAAEADARAAREKRDTSLIAERSQTDGDELSNKSGTGVATQAREMSAGEAATKHGDEGGDFNGTKDARLHTEALRAMEEAFQAEIDVIEELRLQAKTAVHSIPQLPPRLPLDGIVLVGPIQNSLLAPEELLLQLLAGCPSLKIESLDILVGKPVRKTLAGPPNAETTNVMSSAGMPLKEKMHLAEETRKADVAAKLVAAADAAAGSGTTSAEERSRLGGKDSEEKNLQQQQVLYYEPVWPESTLTYPSRLIPIETRKKGRLMSAEVGNEWVRRQGSGSTGSTGSETLLSRRKREREEGSQGSSDLPKEGTHSQSQSGILRKDIENPDKLTGGCLGVAGRLAATAGKSDEETKEEGRTETERKNWSRASTPLALGTEQQQRTSLQQSVPEAECSAGAAAAVVDKDAEQQRLRTTQKSSGTLQPNLLRGLQTLPKLGMLEVIEEEAEEGLEGEDSPCVASPAAVQSAAQLLEREGDTPALTAGGNQSPSRPSSSIAVATTEVDPLKKKRRIEAAGSMEEEEAQDTAAPISTARNSALTDTAPAAKDLEQQGDSSSAQHRKDISANATPVVETANLPPVPLPGADTRVQSSAEAENEDEAPARESSHSNAEVKDSTKKGKHQVEEGAEEGAAERVKLSGRWSAVPGRMKASDFSLSDLRHKCQGLFSQRELALRLLEYRDGDGLRLCYVARIQCADEASFVYLLSHRFQRMRQQPIHVYPSFCYPLLFERGKRLDREILTHATAMVLAANATPAVTAAVQAVAAARKGDHHDFLWLLGCAAGAVKRGKNAVGRNPGGELGERSLLLSSRNLPSRRLAGAAQASTLDMLLSPLPLRPLHIGNGAATNRGRSPFSGPHSAAVAAGTHFYEAAGFERGTALARLAPMPPLSMDESIGRRFVKPFFSSKLALFGAAAAVGLESKTGANSLPSFTHTGRGIVGSHDVRDLGCCWPLFAPLDIRGDADEHALLQSTAQLYDRSNLLLEGRIPPPPPGFVYLAEGRGASAQGRRLRTPGVAVGSRAHAATRIPQRLITPTLPGSAVAAAALKIRRGVANRSNLAAHRRDALLLNSRSHALSAGSGAAGSLPPFLRRSGAAAAFYPSAAQTSCGLAISAGAVFDGRAFGPTKRMTPGERGSSRGGKRNEGLSTPVVSALPRVAAGMRQQRGFPVAGASPFRLPPPAPPLSSFFLGSSLPPHGSVAVGRAGLRSPNNASHMGIDGEGLRCRSLGGRPYGMAEGMQQQAGSACMWMADAFGSRRGMSDESDQPDRGGDISCVYTPVEGGEDCRGVLADSTSERTSANSVGVWGGVGRQNDSRGGQATYMFESQVLGGSGRTQDLTGGVKGGHGVPLRAELQRGERRERSQQRAVTPPGNAAAVQRAPPPPPPLPELSEVYGRDAGRGGQGTWGESVNLVSAQHSSMAGGRWSGENEGTRSSEQQKYQQQYQQQQRPTGAIAGAAGGRRSRISGWTDESNRAVSCGREQQAPNVWDSGQRRLGRGQTSATGGVGADGPNVNTYFWGASQHQQGMLSNVGARMQQEGTWGGGLGEKDRETTGLMWPQHQKREGADMSGGGGGQPGRTVPYSEKALHGVPPQPQLQAQLQPGMRGNRISEGRGTSVGSAEWGSLGDTIVSDAAARAAAALMACQQQKTGEDSCKGGSVDVWQSQASTWDGAVGASGRAYKRGGSSGTVGGGSEHSYGRGDTCNQRPFTDGTGGRTSSNVDNNLAGRQVLLEAGGTTGVAAAGTTWGGNNTQVAICGQQKQQQGYFRRDASTAEGSNTEAATSAGAGANFASGDTGGERGTLLAADEGDNSRGNAWGTARVGRGARVYGPPAPPVAPPRGGTTAFGEAAAPRLAHSVGFPVGGPVQGEVAADSSAIHTRERYAFMSRSGVVGAGRDPAMYEVEGGQIPSGAAPDTGKRGGAAKDLAPYQGGKGVTAPERLQQHAFNGGNAEYSMMKHSGSGGDSWTQVSGGTNYTRAGPHPPGGRGGYNRGRTAEADVCLPVVGGAAAASGSSSSSMPPYSGYPAPGRGSGAAPGRHPAMITGEPGIIGSTPRGTGIAGEGYNFGSGSSVAVPHGGAVPPGKAYGEGGITEGRQTEAALRPARPGAGELSSAAGMGTPADTQQQFAPRGSGTQGMCRSAEQPNQGRGDGIPVSGNVIGGSAGAAGPGGLDGRRLPQRSGRRFNPVPKSGATAGGGPPSQRAHIASPPVPPGPPQWTIQRLFQAAGTPRPPPSGTGVEQQQFGSSMSWENASRAGRGGAAGRGMGSAIASGGSDGGPLGAAGFMQQQQQHHSVIPKQRQADWGAGFGHTGDGSVLLWPAKAPPEGVMPATAGGQQSSTQQQQQTAMMIQFAQQLALMQQQQQGLANSTARGTSVDSLNVAANPLAGLIGNFQQGNTGLASSNMSQQQLQQQVLMMCMLHQQQQQQQAGSNAPIPAMSAVDLQQLMLYTQYYSMLLSGMSEQQATATVQAQQLLQRQQDEIVKQQLLHHSIQQQQQLQLSLAGFTPAPAASFSGLSDPCKGPPPT